MKCKLTELMACISIFNQILKKNADLLNLFYAKRKIAKPPLTIKNCCGYKSILSNALLWFFIALTIIAFSGCGHSITVRNAETSLKVELSKEGKIEKILVNGKKVEGNFIAETLLEDCDISLISSGKDESGRYEFVKSARNAKTGDSCTITEYFYPAGNSIRWEMKITGKKAPWSVPIVTNIIYPPSGNTRYWTAWGRPQIEINKLEDPVLRKDLKLMTDPDNNWLNPLIPIPFTNSLYYYGAPPLTYENPEIAFCPNDFPFMKKKYNGALFSIPMLSIIDKQANYGISIVLSPEDYIQDMTLETSEKGDFKFSRLFHRIVNSNEIKFSMDIVAHKPDWRCGLDWIYNRYSNYFDPVNKIAEQMHGTGAYSNHDVDFDVQKMKDMAFTVNWKASFDFPYMGMFLPPVEPGTTWTSFAGNPITIRQMQDYSKRMKDMGFYVLNYFNVTEFGTSVLYPPPLKSTAKGEEWKNCNDFLYTHLSDAILYIPEEMDLSHNIYPESQHKGPFYTWEGAIVMDCGNSNYARFLLEQAQRHIDLIPDSYGFCIDRMDWLRMFNERGDDGVSWFANKPASSMVLSWQQFMEKFGPLVHEANKVVFVNNHTKRLDLLKHIDGFFDEFTYSEFPLNLTAFTAIKKPFSGWTADVGNIKEDGPDNFFQKYLYMGAFPMCPFPGNDHSIRPDEWADRQYLDYGPLMQTMKGREWVLTENPVTVDDGIAKANLFKVPDGYIVPVVFGERDTAKIKVAVALAGNYLKVTAQHPGEKIASTIDNAKVIDGKLLLTVPLIRGCAMIKIHTRE